MFLPNSWYIYLLIFIVEISVKAALVPGTYTLTFSVTDPCLLETTGELTIIVDNDVSVC